MSEIVADAGVEIDSDLTKFARDLAKKIKPIVDAVKAEIGVSADTSKVSKDVAAAKKDIENDKAADLKVDGDTHPLDLSVLLAKRKIEASPAAKVKVEAEINVDKDRKRILDTFTKLGSQAADLFTTGLGKGITTLGSAAADIGRDLLSGLVRAGAVLLVTLPAAAGAVVVLAQAIVTLLPLLGAIPGLAVAAATVVGVAALAFHGLTDALAGDKEALKDLSPAAREVVETLRSFIPALSELRRSVQQRIFQNLSEPIKELVNSVFPDFRNSVLSIADSINLQLIGAFSVLNSETGKIRIREIFADVAVIIRNLSMTLPSLTDAFLEVAAAGARIFKDISPKIRDEIIKLANKISEFASSGKLEEAFKKAIKFAGDLVQISKSLFEIFKEIGAAIVDGFTALFPTDENQSRMDKFKDVLKKISDIVKDPKFKAALEGIGTVLFLIGAAALAAAIGIGAIVAFLEELKQKIDEFNEGFNALQETIGGGILGFFGTIGQKIGEMVTGILDSFKRLASGAPTALASIPGDMFNIFISAFTGVQGIVTAGVGAVVGQIAGMPGAIVGAISSIPGFVGGIFISAMNSARNAASAGVAGVESIMSSIPGRVKGAVGDLSGLLTSAGRAIVQGLINGIHEKLGALRAAASNLASVVKDHLPNSPAKAGPFKGKGAPERSGAHIAAAVAQGLRSGQGALGVAAAQTAQIVADSFDQLIRDAVSGRSGGSSRSGASIPGFADGGLVTQPTLAMVGERGPELIVPLRSPSSNTPSSNVTKNFNPTINVQTSAADPEIVANRLLRHLVGAY